MIPKLIVADVDGTIMHHNTQLDEGIIEVSRVLKKHGIPMTIITGRALQLMDNLVEDLEIDIPYSVDNGSNIYLKQKRIQSAYMPSVAVVYAMKRMVELGVPYIQYGDDGNRTSHYEKSNRIGYFVNRLRDILQIQDYNGESIEIHQCFKITLDGQDRKEVADLAEEINQAFPSVAFRIAEDTLYNITDRRVSKGYGLKQIADYLGISLDDIMVFGDNYNDYSMLEHAGYAVAMENANEELKGMVDAIAPSVYESGVSSFLKEYFKEYFQ